MPKPRAKLIPVQMEVGGARRRGRAGYRWVEGRQVIAPNGAKIFPYMRTREARAFCKREGWDCRDAKA